MVTQGINPTGVSARERRKTPTRRTPEWKRSERQRHSGEHGPVGGSEQTSPGPAARDKLLKWHVGAVRAKAQFWRKRPRFRPAGVSLAQIPCGKVPCGEMKALFGFPHSASFFVENPSLSSLDLRWKTGCPNRPDRMYIRVVHTGSRPQ
jgi:hypothetical protein